MMKGDEDDEFVNRTHLKCCVFHEVNVTWKSVSSQVGSRENSFPASRDRSSRHSVSSLLFLPTDIRIPRSRAMSSRIKSPFEIGCVVMSHR